MGTSPNSTNDLPSVNHKGKGCHVEALARFKEAKELISFLSCCLPKNSSFFFDTYFSFLTEIESDTHMHLKLTVKASKINFKPLPSQAFVKSIPFLY